MLLEKANDSIEESMLRVYKYTKHAIIAEYIFNAYIICYYFANEACTYTCICVDKTRLL